MATESIKSIRSSGGDYTSLSAWEAGEERDLVTADEIAIAECYDDWPSGLNDTVVISGTWVSDSTRYPIIRCATGHGHDGTPGSGFHIRHSSVSGTAITIQVSYTRVIGLDVANSTGSGSGIYLAQDGIVEKCLCTTNGGNGITLSGTAGKEQVARNNLCYECSADGMDLGLAAARYVYNNTCVGNSGYGIDAGRNNSNQHIKNNLCSGNTSGDFNWAGTSIDDDYNASADTTATGGGGANSLNSQTFSFVDAANDDWHLASGDTGARGNGTDLSAVSYGFTDDIDGDTRNAWDIGFDEFSGSGATYTYSPTGGITLAGTATKSRIKAYSPSGGVTLSGSADKSRTKAYSPSGGITFAGAATTSQGGGTTYSYTPTGGYTFSGTAAKALTKATRVSGGITFAGAAATSLETSGATTYTYSPSGGVVLSGSAALVVVKSYTPSGGISFTGSASSSRIGGWAPVSEVSTTWTEVTNASTTWTEV